jgi:hypothetical protein
MKIFIAIFFILFTTLLYAVDKVEEITLKSSVSFNTLCSKCHEGQCSGRLTFNKGSKATSNHIRRYSNDTNISKNEIEEFFTLLNYMKKECLLFMPQNTEYSPNNLASFATSTYKEYFIPLGLLKKGNYSLLIKTKEDIPFRVELISKQFDSCLDISICTCLKKREFEFKIDKDTNYFLRIKSKKPLYLDILEIKKVFTQ